MIAVVDEIFDRIDANHDGVLDRSEIDSWFGRERPEVAAGFLGLHDADRDGRVSRAEFERPTRKRFALFDLDDDGRVTRDELDRSRPAFAAGPPPPPPPFLAGLFGAPPPPPPPGEPFLPPGFPSRGR